MATWKSRRNKAKVDYKVLSEKGKHAVSPEDSESELDLGMDLHGEEELCGTSDDMDFQEVEQDLQEEESELEDGQVTSEYEFGDI